MEKQLTFVLSASPYSGQTAATVLRLAAAARDAGHRSTFFATGDGVYGFVKGLTATGAFDVGVAAEVFLARGGGVDL